MPFNKEELLKKIQENGLVDQGVLISAISSSNKQGKDLEDVLIGEGAIDEEELTKIKGGLMNIPYIDLSEKVIDPEIFNIFPEEVIDNYKMFAFSQEGRILKVAAVNPQDFHVIESVEFLAKKNRLKAEYYIISSFGFREVLKKNRGLKGDIREALGVVESRFDLDHKKPEGKDAITTNDLVKGAPISKIVSVIIKHAVEGGASDIHIEPGIKNSKVRYRVDGILHTSLILPIYIHASVVSRIKVMANLKLDETRIPQDGRIRAAINGKQVDFRISTLPLTGNEKVVMRVLDTSSNVFTLEKLGFNKFHVEILEKAINIPHGMILVTGPTGSGKSTTLYTILGMVNKDDVNIITLEDPVEYFVDNINQSQVRPEVGYTFASGLRSILRQDPDIIMVGEIRDSETAELSIHAGLTGHIVFSTLHTNDALGAIPRFLDMSVEGFLLASTLNVVLAQRLVRKICLDCKEEIKISNNLLEDVKKEFKNIPPKYIREMLGKEKEDVDFKFYKGAGCEKCNNMGYKSRLVIAEILDVNDKMKKIISSFDAGEMQAEIQASEMITLRQDGVLKILAGRTTIDEVLGATKE